MFSLEPLLFMLLAVRRVLLGVEDHAILAHVLRLKERAVRGGDDLFRSVYDGRESRDADAYGYAPERLRLSARKTCAADTMPDALRDRAGFSKRRLWQENAKFFTAIPHRHVR